MKPRAEWTQEDYANAIAKHRAQAGALRTAAAKQDQKAEALRKESAAKSTEKLPLFNESR